MSQLVRQATYRANIARRITNFLYKSLTNLTVERIWKLVRLCWSYIARQIWTGTFIYSITTGEPPAVSEIIDDFGRKMKIVPTPVLNAPTEHLISRNFVTPHGLKNLVVNIFDAIRATVSISYQSLRQIDRRTHRRKSHTDALWKWKRTRVFRDNRMKLKFFVTVFRQNRIQTVCN